MSVEHQINFLCVVYAMFFFFINKLKNKNKTMHNVMDMKEKDVNVFMYNAKY